MRNLVRALVISGLAVMASPASAGGLPDAAPEQLVRDWLSILYSGNGPKVEAILADHFQVVMASGDSFIKSQVAGVLPVAKSQANVSDIVTTRSETIVVARYNLEIEQLILGKPQTRLAPRMTIFERHADGWYVTAHANFAVPVAPDN